jgi:hypothetical protein
LFLWKKMKHFLEYLRILFFWKCNLHNELINGQPCAEATLSYNIWWITWDDTRYIQDMGYIQEIVS